MTDINLDDLAPEPRQSGSRIWSKFQTDIFNAAEHGTENISCEAVAGSGKTTTLEEVTNRLKGDNLAIAFNKSTATTLASRVNAFAFTFNALGHRILTRHRRGAKLDQWKVHTAVRDAMGAEKYDVYGQNVARMVSVAKSTALDIDDPVTRQDFLDIADNYGLDIEAEVLPWAAAVAEKIFHETNKDIMTFDFDDQLYVPIKENWSFSPFDNVLVDEAQDLNEIQHRILQKHADKAARLFAFGDPCQSIYGFRGAVSNSMDVLAGRFQMRTYPLSISYRCPKEVVRLAKDLVPRIESAPAAIDGEVHYLQDYPAIESYGQLAGRSLIVCRNNGPIFDLALKFLKANEPVRVQSNILDALDKFLKQFHQSDAKKLGNLLRSYFDREIAAATERGFGGRVEALEDRKAVLLPFCDQFSTTAEILSAFKRLSTCPVGPIISTVHRAKGMEAENVHILRPDLMPSARAMSDEQKRQEQNLLYVALTRSLKNLYFLPREETV